MIIVPFSASHIGALNVQPAQEKMRPYFSLEYAEALSKTDAFTGFINGRIVGCAGFIPQWEGRAVCWALVARTVTKRDWVEIDRAVRRAIEMRHEHRLEATCDTDFPGGHTWLRHLGFVREGTLKAYTPDGRDNDLYARVK
ncbi:MULTISPECIES: hypothetical protein [Paraburkholderia]|uniref:hypothetical protein n=1 Tax=Paraburkholderia TaxID=1822464 RepID=UPI00224F8D1E|nr:MULTISPECIES: hypothetical protein [Paraburkholderia]MCX4154998.1 hypothetical protein [Paraburkholderia aspalathi]MDN7164408.1 hypothetical protein [Paraburkholderia sp. SECH2]MDQ6392893.1 hypothetical protein [Paraburkholderia aspalathi]